MDGVQLSSDNQSWLTGARRSRAALLALAGLTLGGAVAHHLGRVSGSTSAERRSTLPDDGLVARPSFVTDHAITIEAPPDQVWPWLTQLGWHRGGWYTPRWVDRLLFPGNWPSADRLDPALVRRLVPGDTVPDGPPGSAWFVVERADAPNALTLHSTSHVPPAWRERVGARLDWVWQFRLTPVGTGDDPSGREAIGTRLLVRNRAVLRPWWLDLAYRALLVPADQVMANGMLRGIKRRAETRTKVPTPQRDSATA